MRHESLTAQPGRLDAFLAKALPGMSRGFWQQRIADGSVLVDGAARPSDFRLKGTETVEVRWKDSEGVDLESRVIHEDKAILVLDKPSGLIVHPLGDSWLKTPAALEAESDSLVGWLWRARPANRALPRLGLVHRLDSGTSGVIVVAKTKAAQDSLLAQFQERKTVKRYRAIVAGEMRDKTVQVDAAIGRKYRERRMKADPAGRPASTEVKVLKTCAKASLVEARPKTGRTHQIRIHLATIGHPVLGDREWPSPIQAPRLMLHAYRLSLKHPRNRKNVSYEADAPKDFSDFWKSLV